jgi:hypothetical protein
LNHFIISQWVSQVPHAAISPQSLF